MPQARPRWASQIKQLDAVNAAHRMRAELLAQLDDDGFMVDDMCAPITRTRRPSTWAMQTHLPHERFL